VTGTPHDFVPLFAEEARMQLDALDAALHRLEDDAHDEPAIRAAFQAAHSIKGGAAMLDLRGTGQLMGAFEDLLAHLRAGRPHPPGWLSAAFGARDRLIRQLDDLTPGAPPHPDDEAVTRTLRDLLRRPAETGAPHATQAVNGHGPTAPAPDTPPPPVPTPIALPAAVVMDVSALSRDVLARHLRALGYDVRTFDHVPSPLPAALVLISAVLLPGALHAGWPAASLHVLSEDPQARADARARGLPASARPAHDTSLTSLPGHWTPAQRPTTDAP
jgi:two-component system chemotaxis sensor kinase CheA